MNRQAVPYYDYYCEANGRTVEVRHGIDVVLGTWGEVCYAAQIPLGDTGFEAPVRKLISPPAISITTGDTKLKELGFTKLVKRDQGVYENLTRTGDEERYVRSGVPESMPHLHKKIKD